VRRSALQRLAPLLIGVIASVSGLWAADALRADACADAGGRWDAAARLCAPGAPGTPAPALGARPLALAALAAAVIAVVLWRAYTFVLLRGRRARP
jgi:hypothetical protein